MTGLNPITVAEAGPIMANAKGLDWDKDRKEVVEFINKFRLLLFTSYEQFKLFDNVFHCIAITDFVDCCSGPCNSRYQGFTLPNDILGVEAVYHYGKSLLIRSRWRESHTGLGVSGYGRVETVMMAETFPTERDLKSITRLKIFTEHEDDNGKKVHLEVIDSSGNQKKICFTLIHNGFAVSTIKV